MKDCLIKSKQEIEIMREGGIILEKIMKEIGARVIQGNTTYELDKLAQKLVFSHGGEPAFKGYRSGEGAPFPATLCTSINSEIVHGIPSKKKVLNSGDILKIDIGMRYRGMYTDMARTFFAGKANAESKKLVEVTEQSFWEGIKQLAPGKFLNEYCRTVEAYVKKHGFSVVRDLVGHGIGKKLHEHPNVPNYYDKKFKDIILRPGMTFALEPMVNAGGHETKISPDGWTFVTKDGSPSAHYENTVVITEDGVEVLTNSAETPTYFLGIDYGTSRVGLAIADSQSKIAFAYKMLRNTRDFMDKLGEIIKQEDIHTVVIGQTETKDKYNKSFEVKKIGDEIAKRFQVNVEYMSEMFTTKMAQERLKEKGTKHIKQWDNQEAARIILQDWMDAYIP